VAGCEGQPLLERDRPLVVRRDLVSWLEADLGGDATTDSELARVETGSWRSGVEAPQGVVQRGARVR
jgi:hypothetical protein